MLYQTSLQVGLNPVRKVWSRLDTGIMLLGSWEVLRFFHHFVMFDDVHSVRAEDGMPLTGATPIHRANTYWIGFNSLLSAKDKTY